MNLELSPERLKTLVGLIDVAVKAIGIRAMEDDVLDLVQALKALNAAEVPPAQFDSQDKANAVIGLPPSAT